MTGKYQLRRGASGQFYFNLIGANYEPVLTSEHYIAKASALNGIASVRENSPYDSRYDRLLSSARQPYFVLRAANGEIIGRSETYSSTVARDQGIETCKRLGPTAPIDDLT
jgi:uncharacterized protein